MRVTARRLLFACALAALLLQAACAGKREPAQDLLHEIQGALLTGAEDAAKYAPDQLQDVQAKLNSLQAEFDKRDYSAVLAEGPALLTEIQRMSEASMARKQAVKQALTADWSRFAAYLPDRLLMLAQRADARSLAAAKTGHATQIDAAAVKAASREASSLWSKARSAFASGNLEEAVHTAKDVDARVAALAKSLNL
jgi:hypothetical protein